MDPPADAGSTDVISMRGSSIVLRKHLTLARDGSTLSAIIKMQGTRYPSSQSRKLTTMDTRKKKALNALALFLAFSFAQVYVLAGLPNPSPGTPAPQRAITARLITKNNQPVNVNGNSVGTG